jgi:hypothetical protein
VTRTPRPRALPSDLSVLAHFTHHEPDDRLPWPWLATILAALALAVAALALLVPDAVGVLRG